MANVETIMPINDDIGSTPHAVWENPRTGEVWDKINKIWVSQSSAIKINTLVSLFGPLTITGGFMLVRPDEIDNGVEYNVHIFDSGSSDAVYTGRSFRVLGSNRIVNPASYASFK